GDRKNARRRIWRRFPPARGRRKGQPEDHHREPKTLLIHRCNLQRSPRNTPKIRKEESECKRIVHLYFFRVFSVFRGFFLGGYQPAPESNYHGQRGVLSEASQKPGAFRGFYETALKKPASSVQTFVRQRA